MELSNANLNRLPFQGQREGAERGVPELAQPRALRRPRVVSGVEEAPTEPDAAADAPAAGAAVTVRTATPGCARRPLCLKTRNMNCHIVLLAP